MRDAAKLRTSAMRVLEPQRENEAGLDDLGRRVCVIISGGNLDLDLIGRYPGE